MKDGHEVVGTTRSEEKAVLGAPTPPVRDGSNRGERGASNAKARQLLGWQPRYSSWREGFRTALG
jgi:hypothetical protein